MNVSAVLVTRGDVPMGPVLDSLPPEWEKVVWDNGAGVVRQWTPYPETINPLLRTERVKDLAVYGRYAAIEHASCDLIYVQDDDVIVSNPQAIVDEWNRIDEFRHVQGKKLAWETYADYVVCNMPPEFRHDGYTDSCLVGFGACFHRDAPARAFERWQAAVRPDVSEGFRQWVDVPWFRRTCDIPFTVLTPRILVDVPKTNLPHATGEDRMYRQPQHVYERQRMLDLARQVRNA